MAYDFKDTIGIASDIATIAAFGWAVYEFYIKRRFKIKARGKPSLLNLKSTEYFFDFEVINLSEQSLKRIDLLGIWIKRWNSFGQFWDIALQDVGYQEKTKFSEDIFQFLDSAIERCVEEQTFFDKLFLPKLKIVLRTTMEREIEVKIDEYHQKDIKDKIRNLFNLHEKNRQAKLK
ncbi:hypothetical protein [Sulfuricurvum sp.]|uniref:hypothetical protein n=1 Tax=Sulfuricurvum sp. TaxID=2025608 RepID=UPI00260F51D1|nr:hypothetical protein [Sulfuricurvum sp.]MDD3598047.1 hypothetical protein [Sulfuricurvum sp.]